MDDLYSFLFMCSLGEEDPNRLAYLQVMLGEHTYKRARQQHICPDHLVEFRKSIIGFRFNADECEGGCRVDELDECRTCSCQDGWPCTPLRQLAILYQDRDGFDRDWLLS